MDREEAKLKTKESLWNTVREEIRNCIEESVSQGLFYALLPTSYDEEYLYEDDFTKLKKLEYTIIERYDMENDYCLRYEYSKYLEIVKLNNINNNIVPYTLILWD